jgi:hypothetical protein
MMPSPEKSHLKRGRVCGDSYLRESDICRLTIQPPQPSVGEQTEPKKPRRSTRNLSPPDGHLQQSGHLPSPITHKESSTTDGYKEGTITPPTDRSSAGSCLQPVHSPKRQGAGGLSSPPQDTQAFSQISYAANARTYAVDDEEGQGVWGYLVPLDVRSGDVLVLRRRAACPVPESIVGASTGDQKVHRHEYVHREEKYETRKAKEGVTSNGYLIGRHPECGKYRPGSKLPVLILIEHQTAYCNLLSSPTDTACCLTKTNMATQLPYSKIYQEMAPLSTIR